MTPPEMPSFDEPTDPGRKRAARRASARAGSSVLEPRAPRAALIYGYGGLIPFIALAAVVVWPSVGAGAQSGGAPTLATAAAVWLVRYAAVIASFVGALHWAWSLRGGAGRFVFGTPDSVRGGGPRGARAWLGYGWSVAPALVAWIALGLPERLALTVLAVLLGLCLVVDAGSARRLALPRWFMRLRVVLTVVATVSLTVAAIAL